jgi:uncharacterized protein (DUF2252 family)
MRREGTTTSYSPVKEILRFNRDRDPRRLNLKYKAMRASAFTFLRGTCHLFYAGLPAEAVLQRAPLAWICGDLHLENFGAYKGDNRLVYFDLNDFDEACLAPCTWDPLRLLASVFLAGSTLGYGEREAIRLGRSFLHVYATQLREGKPRWIERPLAVGLIRDLLRELKGTKRAKFLERRTTLEGGRRRLQVDGRRALKTPLRRGRQIAAHLARFARNQEHPGFYRVLEVADRIAGTGSLGVERYAVLVEGRGSPDGNFLLDVKAALPSATVRHARVPQPKWASEAERVATLQRNIQAIAPALLSTLTIGGRSYVLRELQPVEQRLNLSAWKRRLTRLELIFRSMGELTAWGQLRSAGWRGSAQREALSGFGAQRQWGNELLELAHQRSRLISRYWNEYCAAFDAGELAIE